MTLIIGLWHQPPLFDYHDDYDDDDGDDDNDDKYIMIQCLFVTFLFIPALLPSPVQSCYDWIKRKVESRK